MESRGKSTKWKALDRGGLNWSQKAASRARITGETDSVYERQTIKTVTTVSWKLHQITIRWLVAGLKDTRGGSQRGRRHRWRQMWKLRSSAVSSSSGPWRPGWVVFWRGISASSHRSPSPSRCQDRTSWRSRTDGGSESGWNYLEVKSSWDRNFRNSKSPSVILRWNLAWKWVCVLHLGLFLGRPGSLKRP